MYNWNTFLPFNAFTSNISFNPANVIKINENRTGLTNSARNHNIFNLKQAEDVYLDFKYLVDSNPLNNVTEANFHVLNLDRSSRFVYTLSDNISVNDSSFRVRLSSDETGFMASKYLYEFWIRDDTGDETLIFKGSLKFKSTSGRFL